MIFWQQLQNLTLFQLYRRYITYHKTVSLTDMQVTNAVSLRIHISTYTHTLTHMHTAHQYNSNLILLSMISSKFALVAPLQIVAAAFDAQLGLLCYWHLYH